MLDFYFPGSSVQILFKFLFGLIKFFSNIEVSVLVFFKNIIPTYPHFLSSSIHMNISLFGPSFLFHSRSFGLLKNKLLSSFL